MAQRPYETIQNEEHFLSRKPCGVSKAPQGWYKSELTTFCVKNNVPGFKEAKTIPDLCKVIAKFFKDNRAPAVALKKPAGKKYAPPSLGRFGSEPPSTLELKGMCKARDIKIDRTWKRADLLKHCWEARDAIIEVQEHRKFSIGKKADYSGQLADKINDVALHMASMLYLFKTYKKLVCLPIKPEALKDPKFGLRHVCEFQLCWTFKTFANGEQGQDMEWTHGNNEDNLWDTIENWCDKRFILLPLYIAGYVIEERLNHQNYIIIDREKRTLERFEPGGAIIGEQLIGEAYGFDDLDKVLSKSAAKRKYKYLKPSDFCPRVGPQYMEGLQKFIPRTGDLKGFCTFWSIWYADRRLRHPDVDPKELLEKLLDDFYKSKITLRNFIRDYAQFYDDERKRLLRLARAKQRTSGWSDERVITEVLLQEIMDK